MKKISTIFLKGAIILLALPVLSGGIMGLVLLMNYPANPDFAPILYPIIIGLYLSAIPYFIALYQSFNLINYIDKDVSFSELSNHSLNKIKWCAMIISGLYVLILPFIADLAQMDDAPGLILMALVPIFASLVITVFAALLQRIFKEARDIKSENDLTV